MCMLCFTSSRTEGLDNTAWKRTASKRLCYLFALEGRLHREGQCLPTNLPIHWLMPTPAFPPLHKVGETQQHCKKIDGPERSSTPKRGTVTAGGQCNVEAREGRKNFVASAKTLSHRRGAQFAHPHRFHRGSKSSRPPCLSDVARKEGVHK